MDILSSWIIALLLHLGMPAGSEMSQLSKDNPKNPSSTKSIVADSSISVNICLQKSKARQFSLLPSFSATLTDTLVLTDQGLPGASPDDYIEYTLTISNTSASTAREQVIATFNLDENTSFVSQSVKSSVIAIDDQYTAIGNISISVPVADGLLKNDINLDNDPLIAAIHDTTGLKGSLVLFSNGSFTFNPLAGYRGVTSFTYRVNDGTFTRLGKVTITITSAVWFIKSNATAPGDGRLSTPFSSVSNFNSLANDQPGDCIFLYSGSYSGTFTLLDRQRLIGQATNAASLYAACNFSTPLFPPISGSVLPTLASTAPVMNSSGSTVTTGKKNHISGVNIANMGGTCLTASSFDSLTIRTLELSNTMGPALQLSTGYLDVNMKKVSSSGGTYGVKISSTTGSFKITGTASTNESGGVIQAFSQRGIELTNAKDVQLSNIKILSTSISANQAECTDDQNLTCFAGVHASNVQGLLLQNIDIPQLNANAFNLNGVKNLTMLSCTVDQSGDYYYESGINAVNLFDTCSIRSSSFNNLGSRAVSLNRNANDTLTLTVANCTFYNTGGSAFGQDLFEINSKNSGLTTVKIQNSTFQKAKTKAIQGLAGDASTLNISVTESTIDTLGGNMAGIDVSAIGNAKLNYNINQNVKIVSKGEVAFLSSTYGSATMEGRINGNTLIQKTSPVPDVFSGIRVLQEGNGWIKSELKNNPSIQLKNGEAGVQAISRNASSTTGRLDFTATGNNITTDSNSVDAIEMRTASSLASTESNIGCLKAANNQVTASSLRIFRVRKVNLASQLLMEGMGTNITDYWALNGNTGMGDSIVSYGTLMYGATCLLPGHPTTFSQMPDIAAGKPMQYEKETNAAPSDPSEDSSSPKTLDAKPSLSLIVSGQQIQVGGAGFPIPAEKYITIVLRVKVNSSIPAGVCTIAAQGKIASQLNSDIVSDDPDSAPQADSTFTDLHIPVSVTCPASRTVDINNASCTSTQSVPAAWEGCPTATLTYTIQNQAITFPYSFPSGISRVHVTATGSDNSTDTCSFTITVNPVHLAYNVDGGDTLCIDAGGATISLADSDSNITYQLYRNGVSTGVSTPGTGGPIYFAGQTTSGTYTVRGASYVGCVVNMLDSALVKIISLPDAGTGKDTVLCGPSSAATLSASALNGSGSWSVLTGPATSSTQFANTMAANTVFTPTGGTGSYKTAWVVTSSVCPSDTAFYTVLVKDFPVAHAGNDTTVCLDETISLRASTQFGTGSWSVLTKPSGAVANLSSATNARADFNSTKSGIHLLAWTVSQSGCTADIDTVAIDVLPNPASILTDSQAICSNMSILPILANTVSTSFSYTWSRNALTGVTGVPAMGMDSIAGKLINNTDAPVDVTFTLQAGNCRILEFTGIVTVHPTPNASFTLEENSGKTINDGLLCAGDTVKINVAGASDYLWATGATAQSISTSPGANTTYTVTLTSSAGCEKEDSIQIQVFAKPNGSITIFDNSGTTQNDAIICFGDSIRLNAETGFTYFWSDGSTSQNRALQPASTQAVTCTMRDVQGCFDRDTIDLQVKDLPALTLSVNESSVTANDGIVCGGADATILANGAATYEWADGQTTDQILVQPATSTTYVVIGTDLFGCKASDSITVQVKILPDAGISGPVNMVCAGIGSQLTATGGILYLWSDGQTGNQIFANPARTTTYIVTITDADGCTGTADFVYEVDLCCVKPGIAISQIVQPTCQQGGSVSFSGLPSGTWTLFQEGIIKKIYNASGPQYTASGIPEGVYRFKVVDENGCASLLTPAFQAILVTH